jgi:hypothetical protein
MLVTVRSPNRTARLSEHARQRCREMGLRTKAVKAVVADAEIDVPAPDGGRLLVGGVLAVIYDPGRQRGHHRAEAMDTSSSARSRGSCWRSRT